MTADLLAKASPYGRSINTLISAIIIILAGLLALYGSYYMCRLPLETLLREWFADDSFYYFQTARNLVQSGIPTFDGENLTNGFQPLWFLIVSTFYILPLNAIQALHAIKFTEFIIVFVGFSVLVITLQSLRVAGFFSIFLLVYFVHFKILYIGLETAVNLCTIALSIFFFVRLTLNPQHLLNRLHLVLFSALLFLTTFARLENLLFAILGLIALIIFKYRSHKEITYADIGAICIPFVLLVAINMIANYMIFGVPVPVSGLVKSWLSSTQNASKSLWETFYGNLRFMLKLRVVSHGFLWGSAAVGLVLFSRIFVWYRDSERYVDHTFDIIIIWLFLFHLLKTLIYALTGNPSTLGTEWYYVSGPVLSGISLAFVIDRAVLILTKVGEMKGYRNVVIAACTFTMALGICVSIIGGKMVYNTLRQYDARSRSNELDWRIASYRFAQWLNANIDLFGSKKPSIGVFDAGIVGYFSDIKIVNLDGLINSTQYYNVLRNGNWEAFLKEKEIRYVANAVTDLEESHFNQYVADRTGRSKPVHGTFEVVHRDDANQFTWAGEQKYRLFRYSPPLEMTDGRLTNSK